MKRIGVFAFYEKNGVVEDYILYLLKKMSFFFSKMICLSNGPFLGGEEKKLSPFFDEIIIRENQGYDVTAFKEGYYHIQNELPEYDELLFFNGTFYGPVLPLDELFGKMEGRNVDFWGVSRHPESRLKVVENTGLDYTPEHLQSYFIAVRKKMFQSVDFKEYWDSMEDIITYNDAVVKHELRFTRYFSERGFKWEAYLETSWLERFHEYVMVSHPEESVIEQRCPFIKRKALLNSLFPTIWPNELSRENDLIQFLRNYTDYPVEFILQDLCHHEKTVDIENALSRVVILDGEQERVKDTLTLVCIDTPYYLDSYMEFSDDLELSITICTEGITDNGLEFNKDNFLIVKEEDALQKILDVLEKSNSSYVFFTTNHGFSGCKYDLMDDRYRAGVEEAYRNRKFAQKIGEIERYFEQNKDICAVIPGASWGNALIASLGEEENRGFDKSALNTYSGTFFALRQDVIATIKETSSMTLKDMSFIPSLILKKRMKEIAVVFSRKEAHSSLRYVPSLQRQNVKDAKTIQRYDYARAFADDFIHKKGFKERLWFLMLALLPNKRKQVGERLKDGLRKYDE